MSDVRGSRLFTDLNNIFRKDLSIDEYDVIPVTEPVHNKSPLVVIEHKLGVELWCIPILYQYAYDKLLSWRARDGTEKFLEPGEVCNLCRAVLLVNPECYTVWNIRKECVENGDLTVDEDLKLGELILTKHPKSPETFIHRRWLLQRLLNKSLLSSNDSNHSNSSVESSELLVGVDGISVNFLPTNQNTCSNNHILPKQIDRNLHRTVHHEFDICLRAAEHYACNYNAWSHRIWLIQAAFNSAVQVLLSEFRTTVTWFTQHVSDHCGFHYRQFLLKSLINQSQAVSCKFHVDVNDLLNQEFDKTTDLIGTYPGHEALWYHRKFVLHQIIDEIKTKKDQLRETLSKDNGIDLKRSRVESERQQLLEKELNLVSNKELLSCDKRECELANRYIVWIKRMLSL
ncbi:hypothetical protein SNE40_011934 [Patella caerulea]|uniref:Protein prenyltransferase alpha subunit repeat-containing protein 1 n=1 Tax=Patella caerulea TaxID=87958 RepID=A0AAN8JNS5_PATCE